MTSGDEKKSLLEEYTELSKNSLIKVQFSCSGNSTSIDEPEVIPIVPESFVPESVVSYTSAQDEDVEAIIALLKTNNLPISDLATGHRMFLVAHANNQVIGCVAIEIYGEAGLLRSLVLNKSFSGKGIGQQLVTEAETWSCNNGIKELYLLTTTAAEFFPKMGWKNTERTTVPESIAQSSEFSSVCPSTAVCMSKTIN